MTDHIEKVREQAERIAQAELDRHYKEFDYDPDAREENRRWDYGFVTGSQDGQVDLASRLTREKIARVLASHSTSGDCPPGDLSLAWETWVSEADAVLALLTKEGEA